MIYFASVFLLLAALIKVDITIIGPANGSTLVSGTNVHYYILTTQGEPATAVDITVTGQNGSIHTFTIIFADFNNSNILQLLPESFSAGSAIISGTASNSQAGIEPNTVTVVAFRSHNNSLSSPRSLSVLQSSCKARLQRSSPSQRMPHSQYVRLKISLVTRPTSSSNSNKPMNKISIS